MQDIEWSELLEERLLQCLGFPLAWQQMKMYPRIFFQLQLEAVLQELGCDAAGLLIAPKSDHFRIKGSHFRAAVVNYWLSKNRTEEETKNLHLLLAMEPDKPMGKAYLRELKSQ